MLDKKTLVSVIITAILFSLLLNFFVFQYNQKNGRSKSLTTGTDQNNGPSCDSQDPGLFKNENYGYKISIPEDWKLIEHPKEFSYVTTWVNKFDKSIFEVITRPSNDQSLEEYLKQNDKKSIEVFSSKEITVLNNPALLRKEVHTSENVSSLTTYLKISGNIYILTTRPSNNADPSFTATGIVYQNIIDSFKLYSQ